MSCHNHFGLQLHAEDPKEWCEYTGAELWLGSIGRRCKADISRACWNYKADFKTCVIRKHVKNIEGLHE